MHRINYNELLVENFPDGEYSIDWYTNVNKHIGYTRDYFIQFILRDLTTNALKTIERNIKEIPLIALGGIIKNKKITPEKVGELYNFYMSVTDPQVTKKLPHHFFAGYNPYFKGFDTKIHTNKKYLYNIRFHSSEQRGIELKKDGCSVFFPAYIIAQYFYFRSAALIRQIMSATHQYGDAVKGLYKKIAFYSSGDAAILLMPGVSPEDAPEIFRFAVDVYANKFFNQIYRDLVNSNMRHAAINNAEKWAMPHNTAILECFFPVNADIDITFRGVKLSEDYYLALEIIQENSYFPFENLTIFTEHPQNKKRLITVGRVKKKVRIKKLTKQVTRLTPNSKLEDIRVSNGIQTDGRLDLTEKNIFNEKIFFESNPRDVIIFTNTDRGINLNSNESDSSGDEITAQMNPFYGQNEGITRVISDLDNFKQMLLIASVNYDNFSYQLSQDLPFPQNDVNGRKCVRSYLKDDITVRAYVTASINYNGEEYTIIEIEKDDRILYAPSLILQMKDNKRVPEALILAILQSYASKNRKWLSNIIPTDYNYTTLIHLDENKKDWMNDWSKRLVDAFERIRQ